MPENVHAGNGRYDVFDKTRGKAGYTAYFDSTVAISSEKKESRSKPDRGVVSVETRGYNQDGTLVCVFKRKVMVPKRPEAA